MDFIKDGIIKNGLKINDATVVSNDILGKGYSIPGRLLKGILYITIHNPSCPNSDAKTLHTALKNANKQGWRKDASWGVTVDKDYIYQSVNLNWLNYHATDGYNGIGNCYSLSIEICEYTTEKYTLEECKKYQKQAYLNAAYLTAIFMKEFNISIDNVVQHHKWYSKKDCPEYLRNKKYGYSWAWFIKEVKKAYNSLILPKYIKIISNTCNVRSVADWNSEPVAKYQKGDIYTVIDKVEAKNGKTAMYLLKTGLYITTSQKYVQNFEIE